MTETEHTQDPGPHTCETVLVESGEQCTICGGLCEPYDPYETHGLDKLAADTPLEDQGGDLEARVLGAIIARPWLLKHCGDVVLANFADQRNRDVIVAIRGVQSTHGPLPGTAADMGLAIMRQIEGTPSAERVDLTYIASLVTVAEQALGPAPRVLDPDDWFDGALDDLLARRSA